MRKLSTKKDQRKKQKRNNLIMGGLLIVVLSLSVFGIVANSFGTESDSDLEKVNYKGYLFNPQGDFWILNAGEFRFIFRNNPLELENLSIFSNELNLINSYVQKPLYIYSEDPLSSSEIYENFKGFVERIQFACLTEENCQDDQPIKTCEDNFIIIRESEVNNITQQQGCVFIEGKKEDLVKVTDEFLFKSFGIKEN